MPFRICPWARGPTHGPFERQHPHLLHAHAAASGAKPRSSAPAASASAASAWSPAARARVGRRSTALLESGPGGQVQRRPGQPNQPQDGEGERRTHCRVREGLQPRVLGAGVRAVPAQPPSSVSPSISPWSTEPVESIMPSTKQGAKFLTMLLPITQRNEWEVVCLPPARAPSSVPPTG